MMHTHNSLGSEPPHEETGELLVSARPDAIMPSSEVFDRVFENAYQEASRAVSTVTIKARAARVTLSAALCVCVTAGMLILRSIASEQRVTVQDHRGYDAVSTLRAVPAPHRFFTVPLGAHSVSAEDLSSMPELHMRQDPHSGAAVAVSLADSKCESLPPVPVCVLATVVASPYVTGRTVSPFRTLGEPERESLLVCIESDDEPSETLAYYKEPPSPELTWKLTFVPALKSTDSFDCWRFTTDEESGVVVAPVLTVRMAGITTYQTQESADAAVFTTAAANNTGFTISAI